MGKFKWSARSLAHIREVHPKLQKVAMRAIELAEIDMMITDGKRTLAEQRAFVAKGVSKTMKSKHLLGRALDFVPIVAGKVTWNPAPFKQLAPAWKQAAKEVGVKITWGGDWRRFVDMPHIELDDSEK
jgi:peptidoglycan L-alanyl-D-glutamate endopeptidase CwlK